MTTRVNRTAEHRAADRKLADRIRALDRAGDIEVAHVKADKILVNIVAEVAGYTSTARAFKRMGKWYS